MYNQSVQINKIIKQFLILNVVLFIFIILILPSFSWLNELLGVSLLVWFLIKYFVSRKNLANHYVFNMLTFFNKKEFSIFEIYAGTIIGQFFMLLFIFSLRIVGLSFWYKLIFILPIAIIATIFEEEYKKNKKINKLNN